MPTITPFLWFNDNAEQAIQRYVEVFDDAKLISAQHGPDGKFFLGAFTVQGQELMALNGGPTYRLTEAFSLSVAVDTQEEVDRISDGLIDGGGVQSQCGWLTDAFGLSWQIVPGLLMQLVSDPDRERAGRVQNALMQMTRINLAGLQAAYDGE